MHAKLESLADETSAPPGATEQVLAGLWNEVLEISEPLCATDNFFALGGDSVAMVTVLFRIKEEFFLDLPAETMLNAPSLGELAAIVDSATRGIANPGTSSLSSGSELLANQSP